MDKEALYAVVGTLIIIIGYLLSKRDEAFKDLTEAVLENTISNTKLQAEMKNFRRDLDNAFTKIRKIERGR